MHEAESLAHSAGFARARGSVFPLLLAAVCVIATGLLFLTSTLPALRERDVLAEKRADLTRIQQRLETALANWRGREQAMDDDIETLLVEIDKLGMLPEELVAGFGGVPAKKEPTSRPTEASKATPKPATPGKAPAPARSFSPAGSSKRP